MHRAHPKCPSVIMKITRPCMRMAQLAAAEPMIGSNHNRHFRSETRADASYAGGANPLFNRAVHRSSAGRNCLDPNRAHFLRVLALLSR
jgi:hypothetical protein